MFIKEVTRRDTLSGSLVAVDKEELRVLKARSGIMS